MAWTVFAQTHLVAQQRIALVQDIANAPRLVRTQLALKARGIERRRFNLVGELLGQAIPVGGRRKRLGHQLFEQTVYADGVVLKERPNLSLVQLVKAALCKVVDLFELCAIRKLNELVVRGINRVAIIVKEPGVRIERRHDLVLQLRKLFGDAFGSGRSLVDYLLELKVLVDCLEQCGILGPFVVGVQLDLAAFGKHGDLLLNGLNDPVGSALANAVNAAQTGALPIAFHEPLFGSKSSFKHNLAERLVLGVFDTLDAHARNQVLEDVDRLLRNVAQRVGAANVVDPFADLILVAPALFLKLGNRVLGHVAFGRIDRRFNFVPVGLGVGCEKVFAGVIGNDLYGPLLGFRSKWDVWVHAEGGVCLSTAVAYKLAIGVVRKLREAPIRCLRRLFISGIQQKPAKPAAVLAHQAASIRNVAGIMYCGFVEFGKQGGLIVTGGQKERVAHMATAWARMIELGDCIGAFAYLIDELFDMSVVRRPLAAAI